jgi:hypothetical protein
MLVAIDPAGQRTVARQAVRGPAFTCPSCGGLVVLKQGTKVVPHYAHRPGSSCVAVGESPSHLALKDHLWTAFRDQPWVAAVDLEVCVGDGAWRVDVLVTTVAGERVALEAQISARGEADVRAKIEAYHALGLVPLYVVPVKALGAEADTPEALAMLHAREVPVPDWVRAILAHGPRDPWAEGGVLFVWAGGLHAVRLERAYRYRVWQDKEDFRELTRIMRVRVLGPVADLGRPFVRIGRGPTWLVPAGLGEMVAKAGVRCPVNSPREEWITLCDLTVPPPQLWVAPPAQAEEDELFSLALRGQAGGSPDRARAAQLAHLARHERETYSRPGWDLGGCTAPQYVRGEIIRAGLEARARQAESGWRAQCEAADATATAAREEALDAKRSTRRTHWLLRRRPT